MLHFEDPPWTSYHPTLAMLGAWVELSHTWLDCDSFAVCVQCVATDPHVRLVTEWVAEWVTGGLPWQPGHARDRQLELVRLEFTVQLSLFTVHRNHSTMLWWYACICVMNLDCIEDAFQLFVVELCLFFLWGHHRFISLYKRQPQKYCRLWLDLYSILMIHPFDD